MALAQPTSILSHLHSTDGSATFSQSGHTVLASVNGPIEVQRRDELPEEAVIDVVVRPAAGERHFELLIENTLRQIILTHNFPRTLIQITLQVANLPGNDNSTTHGIRHVLLSLEILPVLLEAAVLALLSANVPLSSLITTALLVIEGRGDNQRIVEDCRKSDIQTIESVHVLVFTSDGRLLLNESEGEFSLEDWDQVHERARHSCDKRYSVDAAPVTSSNHQAGATTEFVRSVIAEKVEMDMYWRQ